MVSKIILDAQPPGHSFEKEIVAVSDAFAVLGVTIPPLSFCC